MRGDILPEETKEMKEIVAEIAEDADKEIIVPPVSLCYTKYNPAVLKKMNAIRTKTLKMDWMPDKVMKIGSDKTKWYPYLSIDKIKSNLGPAFTSVGLEIVPRYEDIAFKSAIGNMSQHVVLTMVVDVVDIDTGAYITYRTPGEAGDTGDKVLSKAQTYALKSWLSTIFLLGEGFDPNMTEEECPDGFKTFNKATATETVEMKSKVLDAGIKPVVKPVAKPAEPVEAPKAEAKPKTPAKPAEPAKKPAEPKEIKKPTPIQEATMKKLVEDWSKAAQDGKVDADRYEAMTAARDAVTTQADAVDFIVAFEKVE